MNQPTFSNPLAAENISRQPYHPLPDGLVIAPSPLEGYGLFTLRDIEQGTVLGVTHVYSPELSLARTPLGGFINHSYEPNCDKQPFVGDGFMFMRLYTRVHIKAGDELTLTYTLVPAPGEEDQ